MTIDDAIADSILEEEMYASGAREGVIIYEHDRQLKRKSIKTSAGGAKIRGQVILLSW